MKNCIIGQSGGPTAVINSSLCGVALTAMHSNKIGKVFGAENGISGVISENFIDMSEILSDEENADILKHTPAAFLGSCRYKLPADYNDEIYNKIFDIFRKYDIGYFFYIGGNDSMDTVCKLSVYAEKIGYEINIIGIPKTIDNDLMETDHTPGFGSAAKYLASTVREIGLDSDVYSLYSVTIIEIMGRNAGWLTAASSLARTETLLAPHLIYLPESDFSDEKFIADIKEVNAKGITNVVVAVSEGIKYADGTYVCESASSGLTDIFGHKNLSGTAKVLENKVREILGFKARGIELNVMQRCSSHIASLTDLNEAFDVGCAGVNAALAGETGAMMIYKRTSNSPYHIEFESRDISSIANGEKLVPAQWIVNGNDISDEMTEYLRPLILGEAYPVFKDGVPQFIKKQKGRNV